MPIPTPPSQRAQISSVTVGGTMQPMADTRNRTAETIRTALRPKRSLSAGHQRSHHAADQRGRNHDPLDQWRELKLGRQLDQRARNNGRVESEQKSTQCRDEADQEQITASTLGRCVERVRHGILPEASTVRGTVRCLRPPNRTAICSRDSCHRRYPQRDTGINRAQVSSPGDERRLRDRPAGSHGLPNPLVSCQSPRREKCEVWPYRQIAVDGRTRKSALRSGCAAST